MTGRAAILVLVVLASGCTADLRGVGSPNADSGLGSAISNNIAAQTVDMNPTYAGVPIEGGSGQRSVDALRRYQAGAVKQLEKVNNRTEVGSQGGASSVVDAAPK